MRCSIRSAMSLRRSCSEHGSATAPSRQAPSSAKTHSGRAPISVITTSPRPTPGRAQAGRRLRRLAARPPRSVKLRTDAVGRDRAQRLVAGRSRARRSTHVAREVEAVRRPSAPDATRCRQDQCAPSGDADYARASGFSTGGCAGDHDELACAAQLSLRGAGRCRRDVVLAGRLISDGSRRRQPLLGRATAAGQCHFVAWSAVNLRAAAAAPSPSRPMLLRRLLVGWQRRDGARRTLGRCRRSANERDLPDRERRRLQRDLASTTRAYSAIHRRARRVDAT